MNTRYQRITAASPAPAILAFVADSSLLQADDPARVLSSRLVRDHECANCRSTVTASVSSTPDPFCLVCGSESVTASSEPYAASKVCASSTELAGVSCRHCSFTTVVHASVLHAASADGMHCASCGSPMYVSAASLEDQAKQTPPMNTQTETATASTVTAAPADLSAGPQIEGEEPRLTPGRGLDSNPRDTPMVTAPKPPLEDTQPEVAGAETAAGAMPSEIDGNGTGLTTPTMVSPDVSYVQNFDEYRGAKPIIPGMNGGEFDMSKVSTNEDQRVVPKNNLSLSAVVASTSVPNGTPLMDAVGLDDLVTGCAFVARDDVLVLMKNQHAVATLTPRGARQNAGVMFTDGFAGIVVEKMEKEGVRAGMTSMGFEPIKIAVKTNATFKTELNEAVARVRAEFAARETAMADSMAIASVGLSRGTWRNAENPLMEGITDALSRAGVTNAAKVSSSLMARHGLEYSRILASTASDIASRSEASRRELASMLDLVDDSQAREHVVPEIANASINTMTSPTSVAGRLSQAAATPRQPQVAALLRSDSNGPALSPLASAMLEGRAPIF